MMAALFVCALNPLAFFVELVKNPEGPRSVLSLIYNPGEASKLCRVMALMYQLYAMVVINASYAFTICTVTAFLGPFISIMRATR